MVWGLSKRFNDDPTCLQQKTPNYFQMLCPTFGPCKAICKPFHTVRKEMKDCKNCCAYCIKISSVTKMEKEFLRTRQFDDVHYIRPGAMCVVNIETNYLKSRKERKKLDQQICDEVAIQYGQKKKKKFGFRLKKKRDEIDEALSDLPPPVPIPTRKPQATKKCQDKFVRVQGFVTAQTAKNDLINTVTVN